MSQRRIQQQEEIVVDWSMVVIGGSIAVFGLIAVAATIVWLVVASPPAAEEVIAVVNPTPETESTPVATGAPLILNQSVAKPRAEGAWSVPVSELPTRRRSVVVPGAPATEPEPGVATASRSDPSQQAVTKKAAPPLAPYLTHSELVRELEKPLDSARKMRSRYSEAELAKQLEKAPVLTLTDDVNLKELVNKLNTRDRAHYDETCLRVLALAKQPSLRGLPIVEGKDCALNEKEAKNLEECATAVKSLMVGQIRSRRKVLDSYAEEFTERNKHFLAVDQNRVDAALRALVQIVPLEHKEWRGKLVATLALSSSEQATVALARRALFDFDADVRDNVAKLLHSRAHLRDCYQKELLNGLRYPWPPIADHAADALLALGDASVIPALIDLLDLPDPAAPRRDKQQKWVAAELVRINHLRNCLLCHAPHDGKTGLVRGAIPTPTLPLPTLYYAERQQLASIRADITYLRQDFSINMKDPAFGKWPELQRYDFVVRQRELTDEEVTSFERERPPYLDYPQREAVLHALRGLTGFDAGQDSADWRRLLKR